MSRSFIISVFSVLLLCCQPQTRKEDSASGGVRKYNTLLQAVQENDYGPFLLGSQLVMANVASYNQQYGSHNSFQPERLVSQFNYIGLTGSLPQRKDGWLQQIWIGGKQASILFMGKYIYAMTTSKKTVFRLPYSVLKTVTEENTKIEPIEVDCGTNKSIEGVYETNDGNFIVQCVDTDSQSDDYKTRFLYKVTLDDNLRATPSFLFKCVESTINTCGVREHWSFKQYGNKVLISPYGGGRTGQLWLSEDFGNSFNCIFNIANTSTFVATKPNGLGGYGAVGIHPIPSQISPAQKDDFWDSVSKIGNGNRHIHSCCYDEIFDRIWLVMGDDKYQATGIYWSDDQGKTWSRKSLLFNYSDIDKGPYSQMLQVVSLDNCVLFGTDGWGNGIFRYNRGSKEEIPEIEFVFAWSPNKTGLEGVANHTIVTDEGVMLMIFAPDSKKSFPPGGVVASDGYHFRKVYVDQFNNDTLDGMKIGWTSFLRLHEDNLYIRTKAKNEIIIIEDFNVF